MAHLAANHGRRGLPGRLRGSCEFATPSYHGPRNGASSFLRMDTSVPSESSSLSSEPSQASKNTKPPPSSINEADIERDTEAEAPGNLHLQAPGIYRPTVNAAFFQ